ncbi:immediate early response 3-interacting protein 1, partial [Tremellales sp. Uapishka_1]
MAFFLGFFGRTFYVSILLTNAIVVLSEERFLGKIGWTNRSGGNTNSGFGTIPSNPNIYDGGHSSGEVSIKAKLINLIEATRTLMRVPLIGINVLIILYELAWG